MVATNLHHTASTASPSGRLLDQVRERIRYLHYSRRTEEAYLYWIKAFIRFHGLRHPLEMGANEVEAFLRHLVNQRSIAGNTHKQALSALLFLYGKVLGQHLPWMGGLQRPKAAQRLPVVLTQEEIARLLAALPPQHRLLGQLLYGTGMRLMEGLRLRVKDIDFEHRAIVVREGKGAKDRTVMLPDSLVLPLRAHLQQIQLWWQADRDAGRGPSTCRMRSIARTRAPATAGHGSGYSRSPSCLSTPEPVMSGDITRRIRRFSGLSRKRWAWRR